MVPCINSLVRGSRPNQYKWVFHNAWSSSISKGSRIARKHGSISSIYHFTWLIMTVNFDILSQRRLIYLWHRSRLFLILSPWFSIFFFEDFQKLVPNFVSFAFLQITTEKYIRTIIILLYVRPLENFFFFFSSLNESLRNLN